MLASGLVGSGAGNLFGDWSIADADLALMLQRIAVGGDPLPEPLAHYVDRQWSRPSLVRWRARGEAAREQIAGQQRLDAGQHGPGTGIERKATRGRPRRSGAHGVADRRRIPGTVLDRGSAGRTPREQPVVEREVGGQRRVVALDREQPGDGADSERVVALTPARRPPATARDHGWYRDRHGDDQSVPRTAHQSQTRLVFEPAQFLGWIDADVAVAADRDCAAPRPPSRSGTARRRGWPRSSGRGRWWRGRQRPRRVRRRSRASRGRGTSDRPRKRGRATRQSASFPAAAGLRRLRPAARSRGCGPGNRGRAPRALRATRRDRLPDTARSECGATPTVTSGSAAAITDRRSSRRP